MVLYSPVVAAAALMTSVNDAYISFRMPLPCQLEMQIIMSSFAMGMVCAWGVALCVHPFTIGVCAGLWLSYCVEALRRQARMKFLRWLVYGVRLYRARRLRFARTALCHDWTQV